MIGEEVHPAVGAVKFESESVGFVAQVKLPGPEGALGSAEAASVFAPQAVTCGHHAQLLVGGHFYFDGFFTDFGAVILVKLGCEVVGDIVMICKGCASGPFGLFILRLAIVEGMSSFYGSRKQLQDVAAQCRKARQRYEKLVAVVGDFRT